jgi:hypothetical protein
LRPEAQPQEKAGRKTSHKTSQMKKERAAGSSQSIARQGSDALAYRAVP